MAKDLIDLRLSDILPDSIAGIQEVQDAAKAIDPEMISVSQSIREALILSRIDELSEPVLDLLAWQYHIDNYEPLGLPIEQKRAQVRDAINIHRRKGTPWAMKKELENLGYSVELIEETGQPYIFDLYVLLDGQADTMKVYNATVNAAKRTKNARSKIGNVRLASVTHGTIRAAAACVHGVHIEVFPWAGDSTVQGKINVGAAATSCVCVTVGPATT